jgi:5,5'-dehydrodivanillate O-demethylase
MMTTIDRSLSDDDSNDLAELSKIGPGSIAGRYFRRFWLPVAELNELEPGRAKSIQVFGERFTFYRGQSGEPHLVDYYCAHRSSPLFTGHVEGDCIRCFYHGWSYDSTGQCVEQPAEDQSFAQKVRISGYAVREYLGLVFAYLGDDEPPAFQMLDLFSAPGLNTSSSYIRRTNYLNSMENGLDYTHPYFVHKRSEFTGIGMNREIPRIDAAETEYGIVGKRTYSDGRLQINHVLMPLAALIVNVEGTTTFDHLAYRIPIDDNSHRSFILNHANVFGEERERLQALRAKRREMLKTLPPESEIVARVFDGEVHVDDVDESRPDIVSIQDTVAMELQPPPGQRRADRLGRGDVGIILLRKMLRRELKALAADAPVREWRWPNDLAAKINVASDSLEIVTTT